MDFPADKSKAAWGLYPATNHAFRGGHPFPAGLEDAIAAYRGLLEDHSPRQLVVAGDSAGGGLSVALLLSLRDRGIPMPAAAVLFSPFVDLAATGDSITANSARCAMFSSDAFGRAAQFYVGEGDRRAPLASPLYADLRGLPPLLIHVAPIFTTVSAVVIGLAGISVLVVGLSPQWRLLPAVLALAAAVSFPALQFGAISGSGDDTVQQVARQVLAARTGGERVATFHVFVRNLVFYTHVATVDLINEDLMMRVRAYENNVFVVLNGPFNSVVADPSGELVARRGPEVGEGILYAEIDLRRRDPEGGPIARRHPEYYAELGRTP